MELTGDDLMYTVVHDYVMGQIRERRRDPEREETPPTGEVGGAPEDRAVRR